MRSICNIDFKVGTAWGSSAIAYSQNEILLSIYPAASMKTNFRIEMTDITGKVTTNPVTPEINGLIEQVMYSSYYMKAGSFKVRLLSDEGNSPYINFKTLEDLTDGDDIICKYRFATQTFEVYKIVIDSGGGGGDYDDKPLWDAVEEIRVKYLTVDVFNAEKATIYNLIAEKANITDLTAINAEIENLKANKVDIGDLTAEVARIEELIAKKANIDDLHALEATIEELNAHIANIDKAIIDVAYIQDLEAINARIDNIEAGNIDTDALEAHFARIDLANIKDGCITNAMIGEGVIESAQIADGSITDAKIVTLTANKLTAGRIDASDIEVVNLNCANLTVGTINGKQITNGAIDWDKLASQVGDTIHTADKNASDALGKADSALTSANGKNTIYYQTAMPTGGTYKINDIWLDTDDGNKMYCWNGKAWTAQQFGTNAIKNAAITNALIADAAINNAKIANLDAGKITTGTLAADRIASNSIVAGKLAANSVTTANLQADCVNADKIAAKSINAEHINGAIITGDKIVAGAITGDKIAAKTIDATKIVANTITAAQIKAGTITATEIDVGSIKAVILTANSITATQIAANSITAEKIKADAVTAAKIATDAIKSRNYIAGSVGSFLNLADGSFSSKNLKWNANGDLTASNANITGAINATSGTFKGTVSASTITGSTINGGTIKGASISGNTISGGSISGTSISGTNISGGSISGASISGGSITSGTNINVSTDLKVGNNIYLSQGVNSIKKIEFTSGNMIMNTWTNSYNYLTMRSGYRCALVSNNAQVWVMNDGTAGITTDKQINLSSYKIYFARANIGAFKEASGNLRNILRAETNGGAYLGTTSYRWNTAFFTNAITASDLKEKEIIHRDMKAHELIMNLKPISYHRIGQGDTGKRVHMGFGAQDVAKLIKRINRDDLSIVQASIVEGENEIPYHGEEISDDKLSWGLNYVEFIPPMVSVLQTHESEISRLKQQIAELQSKLNAYILGEMEVRKA